MATSIRPVRTARKFSSKFNTIIWVCATSIILSCCFYGYASAVAVKSNQSDCSPTVPSGKIDSSSDLFGSQNYQVTKTSGARKGKTTQLPRSVVVFDLDDALCKSEQFRFKMNAESPIAENRTECLQLLFHSGDWIGRYTFLPYLKILFDYLLKQGARIAFCSGGLKERNLSVISRLLTSIWGTEKYEALKLRGQFRIHGPDAPSLYTYEKNLNEIIQVGESLSNAVLVDDESLHCYDGQELLVLVKKLDSLKKSDCAPLNSIYYMLGLFKTYFENEQYKKLPLREALVQIFPPNHTDSCGCWYKGKSPFLTRPFHEDHPFVTEMIHIGLAAVREEVPDAILYPNSGVNLLSLKGSTNETNFTVQ